MKFETFCRFKTHPKGIYIYIKPLYVSFDKSTNFYFLA